MTFIKQQLFSAGFAERLCVKANEYLQLEAAKPPVDTAKLARAIKSLAAKLARNADRLAELGDGVAADCLLAKIQEEELELAEKKSELARTEKTNFRPEKIDVETINGFLEDLRGLLDGDLVKAHDVLSKMIGPVNVSIGEKQGRTRTWRARINLNPVPALVEIGRSKDCPTTHSLEYLQECHWTMGQEADLTIKEFPNYQRIAAEATKMHHAGSSINSIAVALEIDPSTVKQAIEWGAKNDTNFIPRADYSIRRNLATNKTAKIGREVAKLKDQKGLSFSEIATNLGTTAGTASRAYKQFRSEKNYNAVSKGEKFDTGPARRKISEEQINQIRHLLDDGKLSKRAIARQVGVSAWTVRHEAKRLSEA